jgi:hypothetical protein
MPSHPSKAASELTRFLALGIHYSSRLASPSQSGSRPAPHPGKRHQIKQPGRDEGSARTSLDMYGFMPYN